MTPTPAQLEALDTLLAHYLNCHGGNKDAAAIEAEGLFIALTAEVEKAQAEMLAAHNAPEHFMAAVKSTSAAAVGLHAQQKAVDREAFENVVAATIERCAQVADDYYNTHQSNPAAAIRALKERA